MTRIRNMFDRIEHPALITFVTGGDPDKSRSVSIMKSLADAGADLIELGIPFTDPMADGSVIQLANTRALNGGITLVQILEIVREFRAGNSDTPVVLMGYANPVFVHGMERFAHDAVKAGVDGVILVDLPPEEASGFLAHAKNAGLDVIRLITPTTDAARLKVILDGASGFLYYVSITGVTGAAKPDPAKIRGHLEEIRTHTDLPLAVGFGIKTAEDAKAIAQIADGVVVGSSLVQTIADNGQSPDLVLKLSAQVQALKQAIT